MIKPWEKQSINQTPMVGSLGGNIPSKIDFPMGTSPTSFFFTGAMSIKYKVYYITSFL